MTPPIIAWLTARSIARGLPAPVADHGGWRVDTNTQTERRRWVFTAATPELTALATMLGDPRDLIKLCGSGEQLLAALPTGWQLQPTAYFMRAGAPTDEASVPRGYDLDVKESAGVIHARVWCRDGEVAADGYAAETADAFIYDRIVTRPEHRRKGLGKAVMSALGKAKRCPAAPELLVATPEGRALYSRLGWHVLSQYSTASVARDKPLPA